MRKIYIILMLVVVSIATSAPARNRHVAPAWNYTAINIQGSEFTGTGGSWHYLNWFGAYYQGDWWIYHINHGWMYPEADEATGVRLYINNNWVWTCDQVYPYVWKYTDSTWYTL